MRFPCGKVHHKVEIWLKKSTYKLGGIMGTNFLGSSNSMDFTAFSHAMGNWWGNPCISHVIKYIIKYIGCESNEKKSTHAMGKVWVPISQVPYIRWVLQDFPGNHFPSLFCFCRIFLGTNFPVFSHMMGFPVFSHAMGNWWKNPCISHMMKYTTRWESNGKKYPSYGKSMGTNFPGLSYLIGFSDFSNAMRNLMSIPSIP